MAIQKESYLDVADNSGALKIQCIHIFGGTNKRKAQIGDIIKCSVKRATPNSGVKKKDIVFAVIVRTRKEFARDDGTYIRFGDNAAVLLKDMVNLAMLGSRVFGPVARELRKQFSGITSLAPEVL